MELTTGDRLETVWASCMIPRKLKNVRLEIYEPDNADKTKALKKCKSFAETGIENIKQGQGLFLHGPVGTGKSHLAVATMYEIISKTPEQFGVRPDKWEFFEQYQGFYCCFISVIDLLSTLRDSFSGEDWKKEKAQDLLHRAKVDDLIILDDIGAEKPTEWVEEQLYGLIDTRYRMERATIFTTNCSIQELENQIGPRAVSRIIEMTDGVKVGGSDYRKRKIGR